MKALRVFEVAEEGGELLPEKPAVAPGMIWRKLSFGTQSDAASSRFVETMLTVIETCHQQDRNTFEYLSPPS